MEEDVKIPVSLTMDEKSLIQIRSEIEDIFKKLHSYESDRSTSRKKYIVPGLAENEAQIDSILKRIKMLQAEYANVSKSTPFSGIQEIESKIAEQMRGITDAQKEYSSALGTYASYTKKVKADEEALAKIVKEQEQLLEERNRKIEEASKLERGSKSKIAEINKEYKKQNDVLAERRDVVNAELVSNRSIQRTAKQEMENANSQKDYFQDRIKELEQELAKESEIISQEDYEQTFLENKNRQLAEMNRQLREYEETLKRVVGASSSLVSEDKSATGYKSQYDVEMEKANATRVKEEKAADAELQKILKETERERSQSVKQMLNEEKEADRLSAQVKAQAEREKQAQIKATEKAERDRQAQIRQEISAVKQSAAQYYYRLRSTKMLAYAFNNMYGTVDKFEKKSVSAANKFLSAYMKLIPGVWAVQKALKGATAQQKKFGREVKATTSAHDGFNISLKKALTTILKYGFGIRSLYILIRKLRSAIKDGLGEMSQQFEDVNVRMSSILTSVNYMKASLTTIAEPLITLLAPALEKIAEIVANISYHVASFIAALSGQKNVYKAVKVQADYAESLDKTAKNAKKAKKELAGFDELNVLHSNDDDGDKDYTMGWELVPALAEAFPLIDKIKDILSKLFDPIKKAWNKMKDFVIKSFKYMVEKLKSLAGTIWDDFLKVWTDGRVQKIFEDIFKIVGDIFLIIGNLAEAFEEAWKANDNGYRILSAIVDILGIIVDSIKRCADITVEWSKKLTFVPLFTAIADVMQQQVVPAVQKVVDLFVYLYEHVFLELVRYVVEDLAPILVRAFGNIVEAIGYIAENIRKAFEENDRGAKIIAQIEKLISIIADGIFDASEKTKEWAKNLNFANLVEAILTFLEKIEPVVQFITDVTGKLWTDVVLPFWKYMIEDGGPKLLDILGQIIDKVDWELLKQRVDTFLEALEPFLELTWETILQIIKDLGGALADFLNSDTLGDIVNGFKDWVDSADPEELAHKIEFFTATIVALKAALGLFAKVILPMIVTFRTIRNAAMQGAMLKAVKNLTKALGGGAASAGAGTAGGVAGGTGLIGSLGSVALILGDIIGALAVAGAAFETFRLHGIHKLKNDLPETASATNGVVEELNGFEKIYKKIYETFHPGETLADHIVVPSDYEKLENMKDKLIDMSQQMENAGTLSTDTGNKITEALDIWLSHGERMEDLSNEEVKHFSELYKSVETYYNKVSDSKAAEDAIDRMSADWEKIPESVPTRDAGNLDGKDYADGVIDGIHTADWEKISKFEPTKGVVPDGNAALTQGQEYADGIISGITTADWERIPEVIPSSEDGAAYGTAFAEGVTSSVNTTLQTDTEETFNSISSVIAGFVDLALPEAAQKILEWKDKVVSFFEDLAYQLIGDPIVYDIQDGIIESFEKWIEDTVKNVTDWVKNIVNKFKELLDKFKSFKNNASKELKALRTNVSNELKTIVNDVKSKLQSIASHFKNTFSNIKDYFQDGFLNGLTSGLRSALSKVSDICNSITNKVKSAFKIHSPSKVFKQIGEYIMEGLSQGLSEGAILVQDKFGEICNSIIEQAQNVIDVIQNETGDQLTESVNSVKSVISNIQNIQGRIQKDNDTLTALQEKWEEKLAEFNSTLDKSSRGKVTLENIGNLGLYERERIQLDIPIDSEELFDELRQIGFQLNQFQHATIGVIGDDFENRSKRNAQLMQNLEATLNSRMDELNREYERLQSKNLASLNTVGKYASEIPAIAKGIVLPANASFTQNKSIQQNDKVLDTLKSAMVEALSDVRYNTNRDDSDIVVQIDGYEVFRAVRNQSDLFKNVAGYGAL